MTAIFFWRSTKLARCCTDCAERLSCVACLCECVFVTVCEWVCACVRVCVFVTVCARVCLFVFVQCVTAKKTLYKSQTENVRAELKQRSGNVCTIARALRLHKCQIFSGAVRQAVKQFHISAVLARIGCIHRTVDVCRFIDSAIYSARSQHIQTAIGHSFVRCCVVFIIRLRLQTHFSVYVFCWLLIIVVFCCSWHFFCSVLRPIYGTVYSILNFIGAFFPYLIRYTFYSE